MNAQPFSQSRIPDVVRRAASMSIRDNSFGLAEAHELLDLRRNGADMPESAVLKALEITGDRCVDLRGRRA